MQDHGKLGLAGGAGGETAEPRPGVTIRLRLTKGITKEKKKTGNRRP